MNKLKIGDVVYEVGNEVYGIKKIIISESNIKDVGMFLGSMYFEDLKDARDVTEYQYELEREWRRYR